MKNFKLFLILALTVMMSMSACSNSDDGFQEPPISSNVSDSISVKLSFGGEITFTETPLSRSINNDLYALNIKQSSFPIEGETFNNYNHYCYGYFDDLSNVTIKLKKEMYYHYELVLIPDGKNIIHKYDDNTYGYPCQSNHGTTKGLNELTYSTHITSYCMLDLGSAQPKGLVGKMPIQYLYNTIERYQGIYTNHYAVENSENVKIELNRWMFGIRLIVNDFNEGEIILKPSDDYGFSYTISPNDSGTTEWESIMEMPGVPNVGFPGLNTDNSYKELVNETWNQQKAKLHIIYKLPSGEEIPIHTNGFDIKRLTRHTLTFSLYDIIGDGGINGGVDMELMDDINQPLDDENLIW